MDDASSRHSESVAIHKLGFDMISESRRPLASVMNRVSAIPSIITIILRIIIFIQFLGFGTACTVSNILNDSQFSFIIKSVLIFFQRFYFDQTSEPIIITLLFAYMVIVGLWFILYHRFNSYYIKTRVFSRLLVRTLHTIGTIIIPMIIPQVASTCCYFIRPLSSLDDKVVNLYAFVGIGTYFGYFYLLEIVIDCVQSSPNMDIKDCCCMWPTEPFLAKFQTFFILVFSFLAEFFVMFDNWAALVINCLGIIGGVIGFYFVWKHDSFVLPIGKTIASAEFIMLFCFSLFTLFHSIFKVQSFYMLLCALVVTIALIVVESRFQFNKLKKDIDILYLPFEEMTEKIETAHQCIYLMKLGLVYTAPCISNQNLPNWSLTRWPNNQNLMIFCLYLSFVQHAPYLEILDMLSTAVDIKPFTTFQDLLAYQIFVRLPTQENKLKLKLERIRKLYEIPQQHIAHFWGAVTRRHWDEAYIHCCQLHEETNRIFNMFTNLIFENPNYDFVMIEFRRFVEEIQGNVQLANVVEQEVARRKTEIKQSSQNDTVSLAQLTRASSIRSSIFLSEFSDNQNAIEKTQSSIYSSVEARPIYSPKKFIFTATAIAIFAACLNLIVLAFVSANRIRMQHQTQIAVELHTLAELAGETLATTVEFISSNTQSLNPEGFNISFMRMKLNNLTLAFDDTLTGVFLYHSVLPLDYMRHWIDRFVETPILTGEIENVNKSFLDIVRLLQVRARAVSVSPKSSNGTFSEPCPEIYQVALLFPAACDAIETMTSQLSILVVESDHQMKRFIDLFVYSIFAIGFITTLILAGVLIYSIWKEFNFFLDIYSFIPIKVLQRLIDNYGNAQIIDESEVQLLSSMKQQRPPISSYQIPQVLAVFILLYILLCIPGILCTISHTQHLNQAKIVTTGFELSSSLVLTVSKLYLSVFKLISQFPILTNQEDHMKQMLEYLDTIILKYRSLMYGDDDRFQIGLIVSRPVEVVKLLHETCATVTSNRTKDQNCTSFDTDINFIFSHIHRFVSSPDEYTNAGMIGDIICTSKIANTYFYSKLNHI